MVTLEGNTVAGEVANSKKDAKDKAAKMAMKELFPKHKIAQGAGKKKAQAAPQISPALLKQAQALLMGGAKGAATGGKKKKQDKAQIQEQQEHPKQILIQGVSALL